jgi:succinyl-diaminopimelate desuccinylase
MKNESLINCLSDMIAIPSVNPMGLDLNDEIYSEKNLVDYLYKRLNKSNIDVMLDKSIPKHPCLIGHLNVGAKETILLDAHLDTVSHLEMEIDPFDPQIKNDRIYGRGSCDTKASMAVYINAIENILSTGKKLKKNIIIVGCADEEFSFSGIKRIEKNGLKADYAIIGEPTELKALHSHKGVLRCYIRATGESCHSSTPEKGENAIYRICEAVRRLENYHLSLYKKKHDLLGSPTLSVGIIKGGTTVNTVPSSAYIDVDRRLIPGETPEQVFLELKNELKGIRGISLDSPYVGSSGFHEPQASPVCSLLSHHCSRHNHTLEYSSASFGTHAPFYTALGIPSIVFGPGSIDQAHTKNEFVDKNEVIKARDILISILTH